jgi:serine protease
MKPSRVFSIPFLHRALGALLMALAAFAAAQADAESIDGIVVRFRDAYLSPTSGMLPASFEQSLRAELGMAFTVAGRAADGAWNLQLASPVDVATLRAALDNVRLDAAIAYVGVATTASAATGGLPTDRIVVKYRDSAQVALARADVPLDSARLDRIAQRAGRALAWRRGTHDGGNVLQFFQRLPVRDVESIAAAIAADADIEYAVPDYVRTANLVPSDPCYASAGNATCGGGWQWDLFDPAGGINMPAAWDITTGSASVRVAILDTGALYSHPDLAGRFVGGYDMIADCAVGNDNQPVNCTWSNQTPAMTSRDNSAADPGDWITSQESGGLLVTPPYAWFQGCPIDNSSWHGTHVAGTIGAIANNGQGIAGINWVSPLVPVRVLGKCGGYDSDIDDAMVWASGGIVPGVPANPNPARVISLSLGGSGSCTAAQQAAVTTAINNGTVVVVAAGNDNDNASKYSPASCNGVITVAATTKDGLRARYSNYGATVEIAAPGGNAASGEPDILSTLNNGITSANATGYDYVQYAGTSMATPHVSGVVSLMLSVNASLTPAQVLSKIQTTARAFPATGAACNATPQASKCNCTTSLCGAGILNAGAAVASAAGGGGATATTTTVASNNNPSTSGQTVVFTATVTGNNPTGGVDFKDGGILVTGCGNVALAGAGNSRTAQCSTSTLGVGTHGITASYLGDAGNQPSTSSSLSQVVNGSGGGGGGGGGLPTTTTLTASPNPSNAGQNVVLTATITGGFFVTGTVTFKDGGAAIAGCSSALVVNGFLGGRQATCGTTTLTQGAHALTATYSGDATNASSTSASVSQTVNGSGASATTTALASAPNPSASGQAVTFTATVSGNNPGGGVDFKDGSSVICTGVALTGSGNVRTAQCTTASLGVATHSMTAAYGGDTSNLPSTSPVLSQVVTAGAAAPTTTTLSSMPNPSLVTQAVSITATVAGASPTGAVNFKDGVASIPGCSAIALGGSGNTRTAVCTTTSLTQGAHTLTGVYSGDASNLTSASSPLLQTVNGGGSCGPAC